jgi:hypothetical protein
MYDLRQNSVLAEEFHAVGVARFGMLKTDQAGAIGGSTGPFRLKCRHHYSLDSD